MFVASRFTWVDLIIWWFFTSATPAIHGQTPSLWPNATTFKKLQGGYLWLEATIVHCSQRPQHLRSHREYIRGQRLHNSLWPKTTASKKSQRVYSWLEATIVSCNQRPQHLRSHRVAILHSSLWTKTTSFKKSKRGYSWSEAAIVHCGQRPQHLGSHREVIRGRRPP